jgi:hypothetical protein
LPLVGFRRSAQQFHALRIGAHLRLVERKSRERAEARGRGGRGGEGRRGQLRKENSLVHHSKF